MDSTQKSSEYLDKSENSSNDFSALESNLASIEPEEEKSCEDFDKSEYSSNDFPALVSTRPSIELEDEKSVVNTHQEAPKFSYAAMLANKTSNSPSSTLVKRVVRVAPSDNASHPRTWSNNVNVVGPKEKIVCVRGLPKKVKVVELIQALKKFGPVKLDSLQIKKIDLGGWSGTLEFQSPDSARAAVEAGKIMFGEHVGFVSFKSAPLRYGTDMNWSRGRQRIAPTTIVPKTPIDTT